MFFTLPIGDSPNPKNYQPWVNWGLIATNVIIFLAISLPMLNDERYLVFIHEYGFVPGQPSTIGLFTSMFLHGSWLHLIGNMLFLWIYGDNVEHRLGHLGYLLTYLATGLTATLVFAVISGPINIPLIGASGAISGVLGLYFLLFPRNRVHLFVLILFFVRTISLPARWVLLMYIVLDNLVPQFLGAQDGVAYGAHIGGFFGGCLVAAVGERMAWRWPWQESPLPASRQSRIPNPIRMRTQPPTPLSPTASFENLQSALEEDRREDAITNYGHLGRKAVPHLSAPQCAKLATWLFDRDFPAAASNLLRRSLTIHRQAPKAELARLYLALGLLRLAQKHPTAAFQHLMTTLDLDPAPEVAQRAQEALASFPRLHPNRRWHIPGRETPDTTEE